jgi:hypothetical protein
MRMLLLLAVLIVAGCASTISMSPAPERDLATVVGQMDRSQGHFNWRKFVVMAVDSKQVNHGFMEDGRDTVLKLPAGERRFVIQARFNTGVGGPGPREAIVLLTAIVEAGKTYRVTGEVRDNLYFVWLEDPSSGTKMSEATSAPYRSASEGVGAAPIFIPVPRR